MAKNKNAANILKEIKGIEKLLQSDPNNISLKVRYGKLLLKSGNLNESEKIFHTLIKSDPNNLQAKQGLVEVYFEKGNYSTVIVISEELAQKKQETEKIKILHIKALLKQNSMAEAQTLYNKLVSENPFIFDDELLQVFEDTSNMDEEFREDNDFEEDFPFGEDDEFEDEFGDGYFERSYNDPDAIFEMLEEVLLIREGNLFFDHIIGLNKVKEMMKFKFDFFRSDKNLLKKYNRPIRSSMMMYGPTGCGKTYIMNAFINEFLCSIIPLEIVDVKSMPSLDKKGILSFAFNYASVIKPVTIFIDNLEVYAPKQDGYTIDITIKALQCFEGLKYNLNQVGVIGASSNPWKIEPDMFRYGRFDDLIFVSPPTRNDRSLYFVNYLFKKNTGLKKHLNELLDNTKGFSYAELAQSIERAIFLSSKDRLQNKTIKLDHLLDAITSIDPLIIYWLEDLSRNTDGNKRLQHLFKEGLDYVLD